MVGLFSSIGEHMPIFREDKLVEATPESWVNKLHYRITCMLLLVAVMLVTCTERACPRMLSRCTATYRGHL